MAIAHPQDFPRFLDSGLITNGLENMDLALKDLPIIMIEGPF